MLRKFLVLLFVSAVSMQSAGAVELGDTVTCATNGDIPCSASQATVGAGSEFTLDFNGSPAYSVDFNDGVLYLSTLTGNFRNAYTYYFSDLTNKITDYSIESISNITDFRNSDVSLSNGTLAINLDNRIVSYQGLNLAIRLSPAASSAVPEASTWAMLIAGFAIIGVTLRRPRKIAARFA